MISIHYVEIVWVELYIDMIYGTLGGEARKLSLGEVNDFRGRTNDRFDVFPFDFISFTESPLEVFDLFLNTSQEPVRIRNQTLMTRGRDLNSYPQPCHLAPLNRVLALSNDGGFLYCRAPLHPLFSPCRIIRRV